ncbi:putative tetrathionate reductase complex, response regulator [Vibrio vulnificus YJ016]|jgi:two-component system response regulator TtrR|uniref:Putative tetrathionate reductase complex, response regulator n=1 Tax=Vibrio vulnificus (strain YJ016) TaxID=196600 RepID=Q7MJD8_VIBVY|nr:response regulator [Vibrio vulnificus]EGQ7700366.1 response regulator transcription factor [Vibrio vulnificus]EGQ7854534.1 response regulator transcription factor [Vibrio vulnificus]EGQ7936287.1 response regulator transcription factor [Vibrio vulnificus]EGQ7957967.1 response regulator transcription factor [Vibrio vulnificus]EGQ7988401.1 response regulator transcription factor [Vibrio vulnificus]
MSGKQLPVYVVDDDESVRDSLAFMLEEYDFLVTTFADGQAFLDGVDTEQAGCVILDSRMPNLRGQQVHQILNETKSPLAVIYLTGHGDVPMAVDAMQAGAVNFFQKPVKGAELAQAIIQGQVQSAANLEIALAKRAYQSLTSREKDILRLIIVGKRNIRIADELCIAMRTVEVHRANLLKKFDAKTVAELAYTYGKIVR